MKQMIKAVRPFWRAALLCLVLFLAAALCSLGLPAVMGGLVNTGVQQSGLTAGPPEAMSLQAKTLLQSFLTGEQQKKLEESYLTIEPESSEAQRLSEKYPYAQEGTICILREGLEEQQIREAGELYEQAAYTLLMYLRQAEQTGELHTISEEFSAVQTEKREIGKFRENLKNLDGQESSLPEGVLASMPEGALFQLPEESLPPEEESAPEAEAETMLGSLETRFGEESGGETAEAPSEAEPSQSPRSGKVGFVFSETGFSKLELEQLYTVLPLLNRASGESMEQAVSAGEKAAPGLRARVGISLKKLLYQELHMDLEATRSQALWSKGLSLLGLFLLGMVLAGIAGLLSFRVADQAAGALCKTDFTETSGYGSQLKENWALYALGLPAMGCASFLCLGSLILAVKKGTPVRWGIVLGFAALLAGLVWALLKVALPRAAILRQGKDLVQKTGRRGFLRLFREGIRDGTEQQTEGDTKRTVPLFRLGVSLLLPALLLVMNGICLIFVGAEGETLVNAARYAGDRMAFVQYIVLLVLSALLLAGFFVLLACTKRTAARQKKAKILETQEFSASCEED